MSKQFFIIGFVIALLIVPSLVYGIDLGTGLVDGAAGEAGFSAATETTFASTIGRAIRIALSFVGLIFTVLTVYAGILWMTARGNDSQVESAKKTLQNSLIGLIIAISSYAISGFVIQAFESGSAGGPSGGDGDTTQCCMLCNRTGLSATCNFSTLESNPDVVVGVYQVPSSGNCNDLEDNVRIDCGGSAGGSDGRCVSRKLNNENCSIAEPAPAYEAR